MNFSKLLVSSFFIALLVLTPMSTQPLQPKTAEAAELSPERQAEMIRIIQVLLQQVRTLQAQLEEMRSNSDQQQTQNGNGVWSSSADAEVDDRGPKYNAMSCNSTQNGSLRNGTLACYGLWDYGDEFGNDQANCGGLDPSYEKRKPTGCVIPAKMCASDKAIASNYYSVRNGIDNATVSELATNLQATETAVREQLVSVWEYTCTDEPVTGLTSEIDVSSIQKDYGAENPDWDFVSNRADILIVGVYEGSEVDNSVTVNLSSINNNSLLVLTAYEPIAWKLEGDTDSLGGIFVTGYYDQTITGVPEDVSITSSIYEAGDSEPYFYVYKQDSAEYFELVDYLDDKTGYEPYLFFGGYKKDSINVSLKG